MSITGTGAAARIPLNADAAIAGVPELVRHHAAGILIALTLAAVLVSPRWFMLAVEPDEGARVAISPYGAGTIGYDESLYAASLREAYDGLLPVSDPNLVNHRDDVPQRSAFPHETIGLLGRLVGGIFPSLAVVTTVAAAVALLLFYVMLYRITGSTWIAAGLVPVFLFATEVLNHAEGILPLRHAHIYTPLLQVDPEREVHVWSRFPAPIFVLAPFFVGVMAFTRGAESGDRRWMAAATVAFAFMIYTYAYYWTAFGLALALWTAVLLFLRDWTQVKRIAVMAGCAALLALPEFIVLVQSVDSLPQDARDRVGLGDPGVDLSLGVAMLQRIAIGLPFVAAALLLRPQQVFFVTLFFAPLILGSITGVVPQPWHYHTQVWGVFSIPIAAWGVHLMQRSGFVQEHVRVFAGALAVVAVVSLAYVIATQTRAIVSTNEAFAVADDEHAALNWISDNVESDETVVSPSITTNVLLASLTSASQYMGEGGFSTTTDDELMDRLLRAQAAYGYPEDAAFGRLNVYDEFEGYPVNNQGGSKAHQERALEQYLGFYTFSFEVSDKATFTERMNAERPRYAALRRTDDVLAPYPANYLYCGHRERYFPAEGVAPGTWVRVAHQSGEYMVYEIVAAEAPGAFEFTGCG